MGQEILSHAHTICQTFFSAVGAALKILFRSEAMVGGGGMNGSPSETISHSSIFRRWPMQIESQWANPNLYRAHSSALSRGKSPEFES